MFIYVVWGIYSIMCECMFIYVVWGMYSIMCESYVYLCSVGYV